MDAYTPNELAKLEERRKRKSSPGKKNLMGKILEKISKIYLAGEKPKNSEISALKAAKFIQDITGKNRNLLPRKNSNRNSFDGSKSPIKSFQKMHTTFDKN